MKVSVVIIVKNEAHHLEKTLSFLKWADEIVVVDDFSTDNSAELAARLGAKVVQRRFDGFGSQRNFGSDLCRNNWILHVDADEWVSEDLKTEIQKLDEHTPTGLFQIRNRLVFLGRTFRYGKESGLYNGRLFHRERARFNENLVHEKLITRFETKKLRGIMYHHSYRSIHQYMEKLNAYSTRGAGDLFKRGKQRSVTASVALSLFYFLKHYVVNLNFMNGKEGLLWSYLSAVSHTVKYLKLNELYREKVRQEIGKR